MAECLCIPLPPILFWGDGVLLPDARRHKVKRVATRERSSLVVPRPPNPLPDMSRTNAADAKVRLLVLEHVLHPGLV